MRLVFRVLPEHREKNYKPCKVATGLLDDSYHGLRRSSETVIRTVGLRKMFSGQIIRTINSWLDIMVIILL